MDRDIGLVVDKAGARRHAAVIGHYEGRWPRVATASVRASGAGAVLALGSGRFGAES